MKKEATETAVLILGAKPSGLATVACLSRESIPYVLLEREDCIASLWKNKAYNRLHLHLKKPFCNLPHMPFPNHYPSYLSKSEFLSYIRDYAARFQISPLFNCTVSKAFYDAGRWRVTTDKEEFVARKNPSALSVYPPGEAPYTGILVVKDEESEEQDTYCWGACERKKIKCFPFPQNKILSIYHAPPEPVFSDDGSSGYIDGGGGGCGCGAGGRIMSTKVWLLPVLNQPLSSNLYYVIRAKGQYKGKACVSAKGTEMWSCCFGVTRTDLKPKPLDFRDPYQQFEIRRHQAGGFFCNSAAYDGVPPRFLRRKGWQIRIYRSVRVHLDEAEGARKVRAGLDPPVERGRQSAVVVGRWYCPYVFVKEEARIRRHMEKSMFYRVSLEQYWEEIFSKEKEAERSESRDGGNGVIRVNVSVERDEAVIYGAVSVALEQGGEVWFRAGKAKVGLSRAVVEGMKAVEVERGWADAEGMDVRVEREEEVGREREWKRFACYVLSETFFFTRMDGLLIIKYTFRHVHKIRCKWE